MTIKPQYLNFTLIAVGDLLISRLSKQVIIADYHDYAPHVYNLRWRKFYMECF